MSTAEQAARIDGPVGAGAVISAHASDHLAAIDEFIAGLQMATATYRGRSVDWADVASLKRVRDHLSATVDDFNAASATAELSRAAREVAIQLRQFRPS
jgi:hypothetical protein